jgi:Na+-transporting NADH:ubiquinone oxidoreductase subunit C
MTTESPVYFAKNDSGKVETIILPVQGYGLWGIMYGFLALDTDTKTVKAINFYKHNETPGLGGEIQNPKWTATWEDKQLPVDIVKGTAGNNVHKVDGLSGATLTSVGVDNTFKFWTSDKAFGPFLAKVREGALN